MFDIFYRESFVLSMCKELPPQRDAATQHQEIESGTSNITIHIHPDGSRALLHYNIQRLCEHFSGHWPTPQIPNTFVRYGHNRNGRLETYFGLTKTQ